MIDTPPEWLQGWPSVKYFTRQRRRLVPVRWRPSPAAMYARPCDSVARTGEPNQSPPLDVCLFIYIFPTRDVVCRRRAVKTSHVRARTYILCVRTVGIYRSFSHFLSLSLYVFPSYPSIRRPGHVYLSVRLYVAFAVSHTSAAPVWYISARAPLNDLSLSCIFEHSRAQVIARARDFKDRRGYGVCLSFFFYTLEYIYIIRTSFWKITTFPGAPAIYNVWEIYRFRTRVPFSFCFSFSPLNVHIARH